MSYSPQPQQPVKPLNNPAENSKGAPQQPQPKHKGNVGRRERILAHFKGKDEDEIIAEIESKDPSNKIDRAVLEIWHEDIGIYDCDCPLTFLPCTTPANLRKQLERAKVFEDQLLAAKEFTAADKQAKVVRKIRKKLQRHREAVAQNRRAFGKAGAFCNCLARVAPCKKHSRDAADAFSMRVYDALCLQLDPENYRDRPPPEERKEDTIVGHKVEKAIAMAQRAARGEGLRHPKDCCVTGSHIRPRTAEEEEIEDLIVRDGHRIDNGSDHPVTTLRIAGTPRKGREIPRCAACGDQVQPRPEPPESPGPEQPVYCVSCQRMRDRIARFQEGVTS